MKKLQEEVRILSKLLSDKVSEKDDIINDLSKENETLKVQYKKNSETIETLTQTLNKLRHTLEEYPVLLMLDYYDYYCYFIVIVIIDCIVVIIICGVLFCLENALRQQNELLSLQAVSQQQPSHNQKTGISHSSPDSSKVVEVLYLLLFCYCYY